MIFNRFFFDPKQQQQQRCYIENWSEKKGRKKSSSPNWLVKHSIQLVGVQFINIHSLFIHSTHTRDFMVTLSPSIDQSMIQTTTVHNFFLSIFLGRKFIHHVSSILKADSSRWMLRTLTADRRPHQFFFINMIHCLFWLIDLIVNYIVCLLLENIIIVSTHVCCWLVKWNDHEMKWK